MIGHASPEAAERRLIDLVEEGDVIEIDIRSQDAPGRVRRRTGPPPPRWMHARMVGAVGRERVVSQTLQATCGVGLRLPIAARCVICRSCEAESQALIEAGLMRKRHSGRRFLGWRGVSVDAGCRCGYCYGYCIKAVNSCSR